MASDGVGMNDKPLLRSFKVATGKTILLMLCTNKLLLHSYCSWTSGSVGNNAGRDEDDEDDDEGSGIIVVDDTGDKNVDDEDEDEDEGEFKWGEKSSCIVGDGDKCGGIGNGKCIGMCIGIGMLNGIGWKWGWKMGGGKDMGGGKGMGGRKGYAVG